MNRPSPGVTQGPFLNSGRSAKTFKSNVRASCPSGPSLRVSIGGQYILLDEAAHMARATVAQIDLVNAMSEELRNRRAVRGDVLVIDWSTGCAIEPEPRGPAEIVPFPQPKRRRKTV